MHVFFIWRINLKQQHLEFSRSMNRQLLSRHYLKGSLTLFSTCSNSPILSGKLPFSECSSRPPVYSRNLPFWDDTVFNIRYLWIFQVDYAFHKLHVKNLATSNEIRCVRCSWPPSLSWVIRPCQQKRFLFWHEGKKLWERVWESIVCNF